MEPDVIGPRAAAFKSRAGFLEHGKKFWRIKDTRNASRKVENRWLGRVTHRPVVVWAKPHGPKPDDPSAITVDQVGPVFIGSDKSLQPVDRIEHIIVGRDQWQAKFVHALGVGIVLLMRAIVSRQAHFQSSLLEPDKRFGRVLQDTFIIQPEDQARGQQPARRN